MTAVADNASGFRRSVSRRGLMAELLTDASSWRVLGCYLDAAAWIGVPAAWPPTTRVPGTDFGRLAMTAIDALKWGLPDRREVRAAVILSEAKRWLQERAGADPDAGELLPVAAVYVRALCPVRDRRAALDLLDPAPLEAERVRLRRRHPIRAIRQPAWPQVLSVPQWQESLWWHRAERSDTTVPLVHASAGLAAAVWSLPDTVHDPIGTRLELRNRVIRARTWAATGELPT